MTKWKQVLTTAAMAGTMLAMTGSFAFAYTTTVTTGTGFSTAGKTSVDLTVTNLDSQLQPASTLPFTFTIGGIGSAGTNAVTETGTLLAGPAATGYPADTYQVPLPNYGQTYNDVYVEVAYSNGGLNYTSSAGPLIDSLPEVGLAALLPAALLGVLYTVRRRRLASNRA